MTMRTIIPAGADWYVASLIEGNNDDGSDDELFLEPIIAWAISDDDDDDEHPSPITAEGVVSGDDFAIKRPDGRYLHRDIGFLDAEEERALAEMRDSNQRRKARDKKKAAR